MTTRPAKLPRWATDGGTVVEPPEGEKDTGWVPNFKPPARKQNWLHNTAYEWLDYIRAILVSLSIFNWLKGDGPKTFGLLAVDYNSAGGRLDQWVAVGAADGTDAYMVFSNNGIVWSEANNPKNFALSGVASNSTHWVAVGGADGTDAYIVRKLIGVGVGFAEQTNPKNFLLLDIAHDGSGLFVAVGVADGTDAYVVTSADGITWAEQTNPKNFALTAVAHDGSALWVAVGAADGTDAYIVTSADGVTWAEQTNPKNIDLLSVVWVPFLSLWVAVGGVDTGDTDAYLVTSPNGIDWTEQATPTYPVGNSYSLSSVMTDGSDYVVAVGSPIASGPTVLISNDGIDWSTFVGVPGANPTNGLEGIAFDPNRRMWVAVGDTGLINYTPVVQLTVPA